MSVMENKAVFLSYASQDAEAAQRLCDALRASGVEVWFDQNELVGGDAWDAKIRKQIAECALFVPLISAATQARHEGYFRLEWKLAAQRTHMMSGVRAFLLPVVIDETRDAQAHVPEEFRAVQWTRLPGGEKSEAFCPRVKQLLGGSAVLQPALESPERGLKHRAAPEVRGRVPATAWLAAAVALALGGYFALRPARDAGAEKPAPPASLTEAQKMERRARALVDDEPLQVRETFRTAYELCEKAAALSPGDADVWATMARAHAVLIDLYNERDERRVAAARSQAERAVSLAPPSIEAGLALAAVELQVLHTTPAAVRARLEELQRRAPRDPRVLLLLAQTEDNDTVSPAAFRWLEQAEALPGGKARAALSQAWFFWGANRLRDSLAAVERSLAAQPLSEAYHLKLLLLQTMDDAPGAQAWLKTIPAVVLREDRAAAIAYETLLFARQPDGAVAVLRDIPRDVLEEGRFFEVRALLAGEALLMAGRKNAAELELRAALKTIDERLTTNPRHGRLWHAKGRVQIRLGDRVGAERSFATAEELGGLRPLESTVQLVLLGQHAEALAVIDRTMNRALTRWPSWLYYFKHHPALDPVRNEPRFREIVARGDAWFDAELRSAPAKADLSTVGSAKADDKSVAVLAFANLSDDKANEYFSDGISEELLNVLAKIPDLKVSARTSAFSFKGKSTPIPEIARQLGVAYVVEGSVRKAGNQVRITAQLIKAADGFHVWSENFTRELKDIFAVQDEIAGLIAKNLSLRLGAGAATATLAATVDPEAYRLYLEGRAAWNRRNAEGFRQAELLLNRAIELDPRFARAHAALADVWTVRSFPLSGSFGQRLSPLLARTIAKAGQAVALDENSAEAQASLGHSLGQAWRFAEALRALRRAVELNPNYASAHQWLGRQLLVQGQLDEGLAALRRAAELDPLSHRILDNYSDALENAGRLDEAWTLLERARALQPSGVQIRCKQTLLLVRIGRRDEALAAAGALAADAGAEEPDYRYSTAASVLTALGEKTEAETLLRRIAPDSEDLPIALAYAGRNREFTRRLDDLTINWINNLWFTPAFASIRVEPTFREWTRKVGLAEALARSEAWTAAHPPKKMPEKE
ncbi:MAG: TIR domain-containing protein [Verrucomicrobia bacterium]|nr:TIR domain-containing protein [Verrucomicrobiota bacterium]